MSLLKGKFSKSRAYFMIFLSTLVISGSATFAWLYYLYQRGEKSQSQEYQIKAIVQTGLEKEALKTVYLAELLGLSISEETNLYQLDTDLALEKLLKSPVIRSASLELQSPNAIYVDYAVRTPVAYLVDYKNAVIDQEGIAFPMQPFFSPKNLPEIYLGNQSNFFWGKQLRGRRLALALRLLEELGHEAFSLLRIDLSQAFSESYGRRQIVLIVEDFIDREEGRKKERRILRLNTKTYKQELQNYLLLRRYLTCQEGVMREGSLDEKATVIDLRFPQLAFLTDGAVGN